MAKKKNLPFDRHSFFTLYNYPWTLNAYKKAELFKIISSLQRYENINQALLDNIFEGSGQGGIESIINQSQFTIKVKRNNILLDSLDNLTRGVSNE